MKTLYIFTAHIDDLEFACLGYLLNNQYDKIKLIIATTWESKEQVFSINLKELGKYIEIEYINLGFEQRLIPTHFDQVKNAFYKNINFNEDFDILTHDSSDAHTDHRALFDIALGLYKYTNRFVTIYSPEAIHFNPNYFIELNEEQFKIKKQLLANYDFGQEQSYTKKGTYFNDNRINLSNMHALENFHSKDLKSCEIYKIYKWI